MNRKKVIWIILIVIVLAVLVFNPVSQMIIGMFVGMRQIRGVEAKMKTPAVYNPVGERLALYCQSDRSLIPEMLNYAWFPSALTDLGHAWGNVSSNYAHVEMGGGFHHYGYRLELDESSALNTNVVQFASAEPRTNHWKLFMYSEGSEDKLLSTISLRASRSLTSEELQKLAEGGYAKVIAKNPEAYSGKVLTLLRFGKTAQAKEACEEWAKAQPDVWLPHFTLAHVRCRLGESDAASKDFREWIDAHPNCAHYIYLALFYYREGNTNEALKAVQVSLRHPFIEPPNTDGDKFFLGFNGAMMFYLAGEYDPCLKACERMLADPRQENWWQRKVLKLKAAALLQKGETADALKAVDKAETLEDKSSFGLDGMKSSDDFLRKAIASKDHAAIAGCGPWLDELESWFTPFETNEAGFHGGRDIPNPYPKSWKSDSMRSDEDRQASNSHVFRG